VPTVTAEANLSLQLLMGFTLLAGMWLARRKRFTAHGICQTTVLLLNLVLIVTPMARSFRLQVAPQIPGALRDPYYAIPLVHAGLGSLAELLGLYIALVAGTSLVPAPLRFKNWKLWMRCELALWWVVIFLGLGTYSVWYAGGRVKPAAASLAKTPAKALVTVSNFSFDPKELRVPAGTTVEWVDQGGRHTIEADDGAFKSPTLVSGDHFDFVFKQPGTYPYHCSFHGAAGGHDMAGNVIVSAK
jgi:plastocyanin